MIQFKKHFIWVLIFLTPNLHANFQLSEVRPSSPINASITKEVTHLDSEFQMDNFLPDEASDEPGEYNYWQEFFRMMLILGMILGSVLVIAWFLKGFLNKRIKQVNQQNQIKVLERRNLSQKSMLYLIELAGKKMLIGDSASGGVKFLMNCPEEEQEEEMEAQTEALKTQNLASKFSFSQILQKKLHSKALSPFSNSKNIKTDYEIHEEN